MQFKVNPELLENVHLKQWVLMPALILTCAFITNTVVILFCGYNPIKAYLAALDAMAGSPRGLGEILVKSTPYLMTGLSVAIAFRCGIWNIGAEGQFLIGALAATWFGTKLASFLPHTAWIGIPLCLAISIIAGGIWGVIPAILKVTRGVNEVISTIMLNYIALHLVSLMVDGGPLQESSKTGPQSDLVVKWVELPHFFETHRVNAGIIIAIFMAIAIAFILHYTSFGFQLRAVGEGAAAARAAGISITRNIMYVFFISGALAGIGGAIELMGLTPPLSKHFSPGYGYTAIAVALLAKLNPIATIGTALFFGALTRGAFGMEGEIGISGKITWMMQAIILLFVVGASSMKYFKNK